VGYDDALSIEPEDRLMSPVEGPLKSLQFMREVMIVEHKGKTWFEREGKVPRLPRSLKGSGGWE
jgi:hypothetical protein